MSPVDQKPRAEPDRTEDADTRAAAARNREGTILALFFGGALLASTFPLPYRMAAGVLAILALVWVVRYFIAGARTKKKGNWIVLGILAALSCLYLLLTTLGTIAIWPVQAQYETCIREAITEQASVGCTAEYNSGLSTWFEEMTGQPYPG